MSSSNTGTPDWQRGVNSAQRLLVTAGGGSQLEQVSVPPNAQTIIVLASATPGLGTFEAAGVTTSFLYPVSQSIFKPGTEEFGAYFVNVANCIDTEITCTFSHAPGNTWYIYADQGVHINFDPFVANLLQLVGSPPGLYGALALGSDGTDARALSTDTNGRLIPLVPTLAASGTGSVVGAIAAPASGKNYIFGIDVLGISGGADSFTVTGNGGTIALLSTDQSSASAIPHDHVDLGGFPVTTGVDWTDAGGAAAPWIIRYAAGP